MTDAGEGREERDSPARLARDLAVHLEHLGTHRGLRYGAFLDEGTSEAPSEPAQVVEPALVSPPSMEAAAADGHRERSTTPSPSQGTGPSSPPPSGAGAPREARSAARPDGKAAFDATTWTPEQKLVHLQRRVIGDCRRCALCETRQHIVFGEGSAQAKIMVVGEAPGRDEDRSGRPFVGRAGKLLESWLSAAGLHREEVFIANVLKCRPPNNRDPFGPEVEACARFLRAQIRAVEPRLLVALGRFAASALLGRPVKMHQVRGRLHAYRDPRDQVERAVCVLYHPAYVLRQERAADDRPFGKSENDIAIEDLRDALRVIEGPGGPV